MSIFWSKLFRLAALSLLMSAAVDLFAVDMLGSFWQDKAATQSELNGSCAQDDCFCCSGIAVPIHPVALTPHYTIARTDVFVDLFVPTVSPHPLLRPPRA